MSDLKELKLDLEYLLGTPDGVFGDREVIYGDLAEAALAAISALEAKLAVAREALEEIEAATMSQFATVADLANWRGVRAEIAIQEIEQ